MDTRNFLRFTSVFRRIRSVSPGAYSVLRGETGLISRRKDQTGLTLKLFLEAFVP